MVTLFVDVFVDLVSNLVATRIYSVIVMIGKSVDVVPLSISP